METTSDRKREEHRTELGVISIKKIDNRNKNTTFPKKQEFSKIHYIDNSYI